MLFIAFLETYMIYLGDTSFTTALYYESCKRHFNTDYIREIFSKPVFKKVKTSEAIKKLMGPKHQKNTRSALRSKPKNRDSDWMKYKPVISLLFDLA